MALKETKRKTFKFYRSYYDVFNELENDKDKLAFIEAVFNKQFLGIDPELKGMVKFAYISQVHSIEKQVKGWEDATGQGLTGVYLPLGGCPKGDPTQQVQVKEEEKEKEKEKEKEQTINIDFITFWDLYDKKISKNKCEAKWIKLSDKERKDIINFIPLYHKSQPDIKYRKNPLTFFSNESWNDEIQSVKKKIVYNAQNF